MIIVIYICIVKKLDCVDEPQRLVQAEREYGLTGLLNDLAHSVTTGIKTGDDQPKIVPPSVVNEHRQLVIFLHLSTGKVAVVVSRPDVVVVL